MRPDPDHAPDGRPPAPGVTLEDLARQCGLTLVSAGRTRTTTTVRGIALYDVEVHAPTAGRTGDDPAEARAEDGHELEGRVLAAPGHDLSGRAGADLCALARDGGAVALVLSATQVGHARSHDSGLALLERAPGVSWPDLIGRVRAALTAGDPDASEQTVALPQHDLVALANSVAESVGGSVTIFSPQQQVLASSRIRPDDDALRRQAVLDQHGPRWYREHLRTAGVYTRLWAGDEVVDVEAVPERDVARRLAVAVRAGDEILGSLWAAEGGAPLGPEAPDVLHRAARIAARLLLELHQQGRAARQADQEAARALMAGRADTTAARSQLAADPDLWCAVVAVESARDAGFSARRLAEALGLHASAFRWTAAAVPRGDQRVDLLLCNLAENTTPVRRMVESFVGDSERTALSPLRAGLGPVVPLDHAPTSAATADLVLRTLRRTTGHRTRSAVATYDEVWASAGLLDLAAALDDLDIPSRPLRDLARTDAEQGSDLLPTVRAYLECLGDVARAARRLNVHANTVRYRLRRAHELVGLDLDQADQRLFVWLQLRARALRGQGPADAP